MQSGCHAWRARARLRQAGKLNATGSAAAPLNVLKQRISRPTFTQSEGLLDGYHLPVLLGKVFDVCVPQQLLDGLNEASNIKGSSGSQEGTLTECFAVRFDIAMV